MKSSKDERSPASEKPDIEFTADVKARELRFEEVPETEVNPPARTERENLPEQVRPEHEGTTFRDIRVRLRIASELTVNEPEGGWEEAREGEARGPVRSVNRPTRSKEQRKSSRKESQ